MTATSGSKITEITAEVGKLLLWHDLAKDVLKGFGAGGKEPSDPKLKEDQLNELVVAHFRILFREKYPYQHVSVLNKVFARMSENDQELFSLTILKGVTETAFSSEKQSNKEGENNSVKTDTKKTHPEVFLGENYKNILDDMNNIIKEVKPDIDTLDAELTSIQFIKQQQQWVKNLLKRLDENGWVSGKAADKFVRWFKNPKNLEKLRELCKTPSITIDAQGLVLESENARSKAEAWREQLATKRAVRHKAAATAQQKKIAKKERAKKEKRAGKDKRCKH